MLAAKTRVGFLIMLEHEAHHVLPEQPAEAWYAIEIGRDAWRPLIAGGRSPARGWPSAGSGHTVNTHLPGFEEVTTGEHLRRIYETVTI